MKPMTGIKASSSPSGDSVLQELRAIVSGAFGIRDGVIPQNLPDIRDTDLHELNARV